MDRSYRTPRDVDAYISGHRYMYIYVSFRHMFYESRIMHGRWMLNVSCSLTAKVKDPGEAPDTWFVLEQLISCSSISSQTLSQLTFRRGTGRWWGEPGFLLLTPSPKNHQSRDLFVQGPQAPHARAGPRAWCFSLTLTWGQEVVTWLQSYSYPLCPWVWAENPPVAFPWVAVRWS